MNKRRKRVQDDRGKVKREAKEGRGRARKEKKERKKRETLGGSVILLLWKNEILKQYQCLQQKHQALAMVSLDIHIYTQKSMKLFLNKKSKHDQ